MIVNVKSTTGLSGFYVIFEGSTMVERSGWWGLSHLCEHLLCKSFEHFQDAFQQKDITWNAYTSSDEIVFFMTGLDRHINQYKKEYLELLLNYEPTQEQLDNEKKIVLEEYKKYFSIQDHSHSLNLYRKLFGYYEAIGLRSDIENFTLEDCKEYLELYYRKPTRIVNISKYNDFEFDLEFSEKPKVEPFELKVHTNLYPIRTDDNTKVPDGMIPLELINDFKNKANILDISPIITKDFAKVKFLCAMLGSGLNSPLYKEIREKLGLVYDISCDNNKLNDKCSFISIETNTSVKNVDTIQERIKYILDHKEEFLTQERFDIIKDAILTKIEKSEILNYSYIRKYIDEPEWQLESIVDTITLDEVYSLADQYLKWENLYKSVDKTEFF